LGFLFSFAQDHWFNKHFELPSGGTHQMKESERITLNPAYSCWLNFKTYQGAADESVEKYCRFIFTENPSRVINTAVNELVSAIEDVFHFKPQMTNDNQSQPYIHLSIEENDAAIKQKEDCGFKIKQIAGYGQDKIMISGTNENAVLYGVFRFIFALGTGKSIQDIQTEEKTGNKIRIINQWDNFSGQIERGYSGDSIFYEKDNSPRTMKESGITRGFWLLWALIISR
jgi:alpha-glucuronidase